MCCSPFASWSVCRAPSFPANGRIVAAWYPPMNEAPPRPSLQLRPVFRHRGVRTDHGFITVTFGWPYVFYFMGLLGAVMGLLWLKVMYSPKNIPPAPRRTGHIARGGALVDMDQPKAIAGGKDAVARIPAAAPPEPHDDWHLSRSILHQRDNLLLYHLVSGLSGPAARHVHSERRLHRRHPSDLRLQRRRSGRRLVRFLLRPRLVAHRRSQKHPIVAGMLLSMSMIVCNYADASMACCGHHGPVLLR